MPINNRERADHASEALAAYLRSKGEYDSAKPLSDFIDECEISDLICDLLHLSDALGFDTEQQISRALMHYEPEKEEG